MRLVLLIALVFSTSAALAQTALWSHVSAARDQLPIQAATLSSTQVESFARLLRKQKTDEFWECDPSEIDDLIKGLRFETLPLSGKQNLVLVEAGSGCARGGQGANGAMWLVRFDGPDGAAPTILATPKEFSGWLFSVQPTLSHGYPDIVLGWHMSGAEASLSYFRFDGKSYHRISTASLLSDEEQNEKIVPTKR